MVGGYKNLTATYKIQKYNQLSFLSSKYNLDWNIDIVKENGIMQCHITIYITESELMMLIMTQDTQKIFNDIKNVIPAAYKTRIFYKDPSLKSKNFINLNL